MTVNTSDLTLDDLDAVYSKRQLEDTDKLNRLKMLAVNTVNTVYGGDVRGRAEIEGDEEDFALLVWAHYVVMREGEPQNESQTGASIAYARAQGGENPLSESRFGRQALTMLGDNADVGIYKTRSTWY